jgi:hypothetical protein
MTINLSKKHLIIGASAIALIIGAFVAYHYYSVSQYEKNAKEFKARVSALELPMAIVLDDYQTNWRSAIFDDRAVDETGHKTYCSDFSTALKWRMNANKKLVDLINSHFLDVKRLMGKMENPPGKYEKVHEKFKSIFNNLYKLNSQCKSPDGSLQSFSKEVNDLFNDIKTEMNETDLTISVESGKISDYIDEFTKELEIMKNVSSK